MKAIDSHLRAENTDLGGWEVSTSTAGSEGRMGAMFGEKCKEAIGVDEEGARQVHLDLHVLW